MPRQTLPLGPLLAVQSLQVLPQQSQERYFYPRFHSSWQDHLRVVEPWAATPNKKKQRRENISFRNA